MKKGHTLIEFLTVVVIIGIFAAVAVPKFYALKCLNDPEKCKAEDTEYYYKICDSDMRRNKPECRLTKTEILHKTFGTKPVDRIDTVFVPVHDTVFVDVSYETCVKKCTDNNTSQSVINFCIKEECDKKVTND